MEVGYGDFHRKLLFCKIKYIFGSLNAVRDSVPILQLGRVNWTNTSKRQRI